MSVSTVPMVESAATSPGLSVSTAGGEPDSTGRDGGQSVDDRRLRVDQFEEVLVDEVGGPNAYCITVGRFAEGPIIDPLDVGFVWFGFLDGERPTTNDVGVHSLTADVLSLAVEH